MLSEISSVGLIDKQGPPKKQNNCQKVALFILIIGFCITGLVMFYQLVMIEPDDEVNPMTTLYSMPPDFGQFENDQDLS
jgi:hypothetical protein